MDAGHAGIILPARYAKVSTLFKFSNMDTA